MSNITKWVLYGLHWVDGAGYQPYSYIASGTYFDGGLSMNDGQYLGKLVGTEAQCDAAITACETLFEMVEITAEDADAFQGSPIALGERLTNLEDAFLANLLGG